MDARKLPHREHGIADGDVSRALKRVRRSPRSFDGKCRVELAVQPIVAERGDAERRAKTMGIHVGHGTARGVGQPPARHLDVGGRVVLNDHAFDSGPIERRIHRQTVTFTSSAVLCVQIAGDSRYAERSRQPGGADPIGAAGQVVRQRRPPGDRETEAALGRRVCPVGVRVGLDPGLTAGDLHVGVETIDQVSGGGGILRDSPSSIRGSSGPRRSPDRTWRAH